MKARTPYGPGRILVWRNKHGDDYYDASTEDALNGAARHILKQLVDEGWVWEPEAPDVDPEERAVAAMTDEQIASLPTAIQDSTTKNRDRAKRTVDRLDAAYEQERGHWGRVQSAVGGFTKPSPYSVLMERSGAEYEDYEIEDVRTCSMADHEGFGEGE